ncbi:MAG TPA: winged helix-turn-helix domain-containing protein [Blastocatellia bacterium]|jgi:DNA-binding winged helix-turn-helix (wHTH) protein/TolB-like protein
MEEQSRHFYDFGRFRVRVAERVLLRERDVVPLTPKVFEILLTLVENSGQVISKEDLIKRVWPDTFVEEGNLTQNISLLRKALGEGQNSHQYIETIARRGYRFIAPVSEAWDEALNATSETPGPVFGQKAVEPNDGLAPVEATGLPPAEDAKLDTSKPLAAPARLTARFDARRRAAPVILAALVIATTGIVYFSRGSEAVSSPGGVIESIAVLPFANTAADTDTEYFNDKITESLINNLSQLPKLRVVPRGLVFGYKGREVDLRRIGHELNVRSVLTGIVYRRGDTLSIQVDLIDLANVSQLWGQHYDRKISDILLVQEDISNDIFANLRLKLSLEEKKQLDAFSLYLKGRNYLNKRTAEGLQLGIEYFQQAIDVDPDYAPAYAGLADCYNMLVVYGISKPQEAFPRAKEAALKALRIDDKLAEAHTSLAFVKHRWDWERADAEKEFRLAIRYKPGYAPAHQWFSSYLVAVERFDEAIAEAKRAQELDPLSFISNLHLGWILYLAGRNDEAIDHCKKLLDVDPNFFPAYRYLGLAYEQKGMYPEAISEFEKGVKLSDSPLMIALLGHAYAASGNKVEAKRILAVLGRQKQKYVSPYTVSAIYAGLGERDEAFRWLERAYGERDIWLMNLKVDPVFKSFRSDPRLAGLLQRLGLAY